MAETIESLNNKMIALAADNEHVKERKIVTGGGSVGAKLILIGEAPGGEEEKTGKPFVGKAGKNLDEFLQTLGLQREDIYITNLVKVRPTKHSEKTGKPVNRPPDKFEIEFFRPFLLQEINLIAPDLVVTLGNFPLKALLDDKNATVGKLHGKILNKGAYDIFPLYHPASIIYNQSLKDIYQNDLMQLKAVLM